MESTTRRSFVGGLLALATAGGSAAVVAGELPSDVAKLVGIFGEDAVLRHLQILLGSEEEITFATLKRSLNRERRRAKRQQQARDRRERHAGQTVVYRGPVEADGLSELIDACCESRSHVTRHAVLIGETPMGCWLGQLRIGKVHLVCDNRRPLQSPCMGELVETHKDRFPVRLHLYQPSQWDTEYAAQRAVLLTTDPPHLRMAEDRLRELDEIQDSLS